MDPAFEDERQDGQDGETVTIQEYLNDVEDRELEADLVLGGDEGKECTYNKGYMKRQAIFSCLTCTPDGNAGVCTACSLSCHDGHEIMELWTKRNFRCDCGNSKFGEFYCRIFPSKDIENGENSYNHNFKGSYCTCGRPYPDPDVEDQVEMIQCCFCEDWLHEEHIGLNSPDEIPKDVEGEPLYEDFVCPACSKGCSFIRLYTQIILEAKNQKSDATKIGKDKEVIADEEHLACESGKLEMISESSTANSENMTAGEGSLLGENSGTKICLKKCNADADADADTHATCVIGVDPAVASPVSESKPIFLSKNWRSALCRCEKCIDYYKQKQISFIIDKEDSIIEYEKMAKQKREEKLQQRHGDELSMLDNLGHVEKIEILNGIADFKDELSSFLGSFDSSKVITSADVQQIFENLKKRRRVE